ncbi:glycine betaine/choline ABC-type transport system substrate-binding protein [Mycobacterium sp. BK086]|uniref:glycine betaine ABC transporter substrate-binding protein n=1 Tax=Mycobacterium sp. BK086 TaxID=2512165 RepID=UPI0010E67376|nr:glycine betaine ABC transporter substrate-binding protein [Mycobacterium sp. BK086]TDO09125.1 glycine betaine/choline ABC-type transport system substrate-binding protein [Mycobacterium sp. BK086]
MFRRLVLGLLVLVVVACGSPSPGPSLAVGATADPEMTLLANLYAAALRSYGSAAHVEIVDHPLVALDSGTVSVVPGFTGRLLQKFAPGTTVRSDSQVYRAMVGVLPEGVAAGDYTTSAEDKPALVVTDATATAWGSRDLTALVGHCAGLRVGAVAHARGLPNVVGSCTLPPVRAFPDQATMFEALRAGAITAGWTGTADTGIPSELVVLADRKPALVMAENIVPLYRRNELDQQQARAINELAGVLDTGSLVDMRQHVAEGRDPRSVAEEWLSAHPLGR